VRRSGKVAWVKFIKHKANLNCFAVMRTWEAASWAADWQIHIAAWQE